MSIYKSSNTKFIWSVLNYSKHSKYYLISFSMCVCVYVCICVCVQSQRQWGNTHVNPKQSHTLPSGFTSAPRQSHPGSTLIVCRRPSERVHVCAHARIQKYYGEGGKGWTWEQHHGEWYVEEHNEKERTSSMMQLWFNLDSCINYANIFGSHVKYWWALQLLKLYSLRSQNLSCAPSLIMDRCQLEVSIQIQATLSSLDASAVTRVRVRVHLTHTRPQPLSSFWKLLFA